MGKRMLAWAAVGVLGLTAAQAQAELIYATNGSNISRFDSGSLNVVVTVPVTGLQAGETLVGIDVRPLSNNGIIGLSANPFTAQTLYGVGSTSQVYTINPLTGAAAVVGGFGTVQALNGTAFGTDFNPVPDRIRQVSNTEQNLRLNPITPANSIVDTALNPTGNVVAVAYSNNFVGATTTTLYAIDSAAGTLGIVSSPNAGGPINLVGSLGVGTNLPESIGFDISGATGTGFATITVGGQSRLYSVNLQTGAATNLGTIGSGTTQYLGVAAAAAPEPAGLGLLGAAATLLLGRRRKAASK